MKIRITFDLNDEDRAAIADHFHRPEQKAIRSTCETFLENAAVKRLDELIYEYRKQRLNQPKQE